MPTYSILNQKKDFILISSCFDIKGKLGIERRNQILVKTQIDNAVRLINQSLDGVSEDLAQDRLAEKFNI